jgi:hypothetical protein
VRNVQVRQQRRAALRTVRLMPLHPLFAVVAPAVGKKCWLLFPLCAGRVASQP